MTKHITHVSYENIEPFRKTPEGKLLVDELELLQLLADAEARRVVSDDSEKSVTKVEKEQLSRLPSRS